LVLKERTNDLDVSTQVQAIIPNIIHSLDASHLMNIINNAINDKFSPVITIQDCFGTLPNQMASLEFRVKKEFVTLYSKNNFLKEYHNRFIQNLKDNQFEIIEKDNKSYVLLDDKLVQIPSLPLQGELPLDKIRQSKYMIS
jgi:DNA-directed RNA polymerase